MKIIARKPVTTRDKYLKYGFVITEYQVFRCPKCAGILNAGPNYQPGFCGDCGQKLTFRGIHWEDEQFLGYTEKGAETAWDI